MSVIWSILEKQGRSLQWFADKMDVSASYIYKLKTGERDWTETLKIRAEEVLDIPQEVLFLQIALTDVRENANSTIVKDGDTLSSPAR